MMRAEKISKALLALLNIYQSIIDNNFFSILSYYVDNKTIRLLNSLVLEVIKNIKKALKLYSLIKEDNILPAELDKDVRAKYLYYYNDMIFNGLYDFLRVLRVENKDCYMYTHLFIIYCIKTKELVIRDCTHVKKR